MAHLTAAETGRLAAPAAGGGGCGWFDVLAHDYVMIRGDLCYDEELI
jgi:hypothetical protein